jgi:hypothetical protein
MPPDQIRDMIAQKFPDAGSKVSGHILPFSRDAEGNVSFDPDAGIVGALKRGTGSPVEAYKGKLPMFDAEGRTSAS